MKIAACLLLLAAAACGSAEAPSPMARPETVRLTPQTPEAMLAVPPGSGGKLILEITRVDNPEMREVTLVVSFDRGKAAPQRFSLYPPDRAARIAVSVPGDSQRMRVRVESSEQLPALVELRAVPLPR